MENARDFVGPAFLAILVGSSYFVRGEQSLSLVDCIMDGVFIFFGSWERGERGDFGVTLQPANAPPGEYLSGALLCTVLTAQAHMEGGWAGPASSRYGSIRFTQPVGQ